MTVFLPPPDRKKSWPDGGRRPNRCARPAERLSLKPMVPRPALAGAASRSACAARRFDRWRSDVMSLQARSHVSTLAATALLGAIAALAPRPGAAATVVVGNSGAPDAPTISAGIAMATDGDTLLIQEGVYLEIVQTDKALSILASDGAGTVSINALNFGPALTFSNVNGPVTIQGLVLENGGGTRGGGIRIEGVTGGVTIRDCE